MLPQFEAPMDEYVAKMRSAKVVAGFHAGDFDKRDIKPKSPRDKAILRVDPQNMAVPQ